MRVFPLIYLAALLSLVLTETSRPVEESNWSVAAKWLQEFEYIPKFDVRMVDDIRGKVIPGLIKFKQFYRIYPVDDTLNEYVLNIMKSPRCYREDDDNKEEGSRRKRWTRLGSHSWKTMPITISFKNYLHDDVISKKLCKEIVKECAMMWGEHSGLSFKFAESGQIGNIDIDFVDIDGPYGSIGSGQSPVTWENPPSSYLRLDYKEPWKPREFSSHGGVSLKWGICHEMGHTLGLGHSGDERAMMFPSGIHGRRDDILSTDDINGVRALYGGPKGPTFIEEPKPTPKKLYRTSIETGNSVLRLAKEVQNYYQSDESSDDGDERNLTKEERRRKKQIRKANKARRRAKKEERRSRRQRN